MKRNWHSQHVILLCDLPQINCVLRVPICQRILQLWKLDIITNIFYILGH